MNTRTVLPESHEETRETLEAIASGEVDAVVVHGPRGPQVFRLEGPDEPFRTFVERMQEGVLTVSPDGTILYANSYFAHLLGVPLEQVIGVPLARFVPAGYRSTIGALVRDGLGSTAKEACRLETKDGSIPVQLTLSPLDGGHRPSCCAVVFDLRAREMLEEAHAARVAAEEASRAKDQFLAILSHELRSPLNTILGWSQILLGDPDLADATRRAVETIERSARTQAGLIADLLDTSRIIAGKLSLEMGPVDLRSLAEGALSAAGPLIEEKGLVLTRHLADDAEVFGDPTRLQQILTNLLTNAVKFTQAGGTIDVALGVEDGRAVLRVTDTGIGMSKELIAHVFDVFYQARAARRTGLGLGLAIAKQLAEAHGGTLTAQSDGDGHGSTFTLRLPLTAKTPVAARAPQYADDELNGLCALLVDDDADNLDLTCCLLESAGCRVITATSAERALAVLEEEDDIGLIISDIGLPDQDGLEFMREVRARGYDAARLPAIAVTGYAGQHDARLVTAAGYQKHLAKPFDVPDLLRAAAELGRKTR